MTSNMSQHSASDARSNPPRPTPPELAGRTLMVWQARDAEDGDVWSPEHGNLRIPEGWCFLSRGDAFITRHAKRGPHWVLKGRPNRKRRYTPVLGIYAPARSIEEA